MLRLGVDTTIFYPFQTGTDFEKNENVITLFRIFFVVSECRCMNVFLFDMLVEIWPRHDDKFTNILYSCIKTVKTSLVSRTCSCHAKTTITLFSYLVYLDYS